MYFDNGDVNLWNITISLAKELDIGNPNSYRDDIQAIFLVVNEEDEKIKKFLTDTIRTHKRTIFSRKIARELIQEYANYDEDWTCTSEEEIGEYENDGELPFFPEEIRGKGFKYFYFGYINCRSIYAHYFIKIFEENFYLALN